MKSSESILSKHAPKFIDAKHSRETLRGVYFDGLGDAWATDGIMLLRLSGFPADCVREVRSLSGKKLDVAPIGHSTWIRLVPDAPTVALLNTSETINSLASLFSVAKVVKESYLTLRAEKGALVVLLDSEDVKGKAELGSCSEEFNSLLDCSRLASCLAVFDGVAEKIELKTFYTGGVSLVLSAPGIDVVLMGAKAY